MIPAIGSWGIFLAPAKTHVRDRRSAQRRHPAFAHMPAVTKVVQHNGYEPDGRNAAQTAEFFRKEVEAAGEAVRAAGIQPN